MPRRPVRAGLTLAAVAGLLLTSTALHVPGAGASPAPRDAPGVLAPVYDADAPDPDVIRVGSTYYAYTTGSHLRDIPVLSSTDLQTWALVGDALPVLPSWSVWGRTWSPGVVELAGRFVMYYATEVAATGGECISVATSVVPTGPFVDTSGAPLVCQADLGGSIDPQPFVDGDGTPYLYWKSNAATMGVPAYLWVARLSPDGSSLGSSAVQVLAQDQPWESTVESPAMVDASGSYVLFYSGGLWDGAGYGVGYADCAGPFGPCAKPRSSPLLHSDEHRLGPGGQSLFQDASGNWWMAYHAWDGPASSYSYDAGGFRSLWVAPVTFAAGTPTIAAGEDPEGYHLFGRDGGVFSFGSAAFAGSMGGTRLAGAVVGGAADIATGGYYEVGTDGGVFAFDAPFEGSMGGRALAAPMVGMATTPDGGGYWLVASDGGVFSFGDAAFSGSTGAMRLVAPVVGIAPTADGGGYWLVASDGGVFSFGDAAFSGSLGATPLAAPVVGMAAMPQGGGYWLVGSDGGVFNFGDAQSFGSMGGVRLGAPVVAIASGPGSGGYWLVASDGGVFGFGDATFSGSMGATRLAAPVVGGAAA
ncbi:MAG TPA: family 43 glycosylhydrolase [Acidimicrobiales bacterium]|nr:family 43 glycosylhydrolase [Acidimicrobiales bacterium]